MRWTENVACVGEKINAYLSVTKILRNEAACGGFGYMTRSS